jgi:Cupin
MRSACGAGGVAACWSRGNRPQGSDRAEHHGSGHSGGQSRRISPGDVIIVPPGVAHWFSAIEGDLDYLVVRVDPGHVLPAGYVHPLLKN